MRTRHSLLKSRTGFGVGVMLAAGAALGLPAMPSAPADAVDCPLPQGGSVPVPTTCPGMVLPPPGYIWITHNATAGEPLRYHLLGALADPGLWTCSDTTHASGAYEVACTPTPSNFMSWRCYALHADATTFSPTGRARTTLDCNDSAPAEAQTKTVSGSGGRDSMFVLSQVNVTEFSCTVDGDGTLPQSPNFYAGCGDPGPAELS